MGQVASLRRHQWGTTALQTTPHHCTPHHSAQLKLRSSEEAQGRAPELQSWRGEIIVNRLATNNGQGHCHCSGHTNLAIILRICYLDMLTKHNTNIV